VVGRTCPSVSSKLVVRKRKTKTIMDIENVTYSTGDVLKFLQAAQRDVLTVVEASFPAGQQLEAIKLLIKQKVNLRLNAVRTGSIPSIDTSHI
jgi:hypothetical protein